MAAMDCTELLANTARIGRGYIMRSLRLSLAGTPILVLFGGLGAAVVAQGRAQVFTTFGSAGR